LTSEKLASEFDSLEKLVALAGRGFAAISLLAIIPRPKERV
jgi:hypothetical protein